MTFNDMIKTSVINLFNENITLTTMAATLAISFALGFLVFFVYKITFKGILYSKSFNISLLLMSMITSVIILAISSNLVLSLGMVGALSIVRFRSAIKDPIDIAFIFWAISTGIISGAGLYALAIVTSIVIAIVIIIVSRISFSDCSFLFVYRCESVQTREEVIELVKTNVKKYGLKSVQDTETGIEVILELRADKDLTSFVEKVRQINGVTKASLISFNGDYSM